ISADANLGTAPGSSVATQLTLSGGNLRATATFSLATNRGITLGSSGGGIDVNSGFTLTYPGAIVGANTLTKYGSGTFLLSGSKTGTSYVVIYQGTFTVQADAPVLTNQTFTGAGNLVIQPASASFSPTFDTSAITLVGAVSPSPPLSTDGSDHTGLLGTLTVGKSGNSGIINISGNITTAGNQTFYGPVTLSADITSTITSGTVYFTGTVNSSTTKNLTVSGGTLQFGGVVGGTNPLNNITATNLITTAVIQKTSDSSAGAATLTVSGTSSIGASINTSGAQNYAGAVTLTAATTLTATGSTIYFGSTVNGAYALTITTGSSTGYVSFVGTVGNSAVLSSLTVTTPTLFIYSSITTSGAQSYTGDLVISGSPTLTTTNSNVTVTGNVTNSYSQFVQLGTSLFTTAPTINNGSYAVIINGITTSSTSLGATSPTLPLGSTITYDGTSYYYTPNGTYSGAILVVGAGGGGGANWGGGGGAGGYVLGSGTFSSMLTASIAGGAPGATSGQGGTAGITSVSATGISTVNALGGGGGGYNINASS
ncbi:MAG: hypothetical protein EBW51_08690, partial [Actinobacteria bacterium]|nr:hypothetical protein [Actinomycetota bacterium]